ncbi:hypothetical protein O181_049628 [Austropuccinia psidii MF-1]|uniref:Uncharacterized protein n=1 Tax=Austropuccinia psidii MF-1 TaxID=1389203 RepID=A0A9Q3DXV7_9BASI|nr:hypothetical protein [Austropuccinia psidii MF-1]
MTIVHKAGDIQKNSDVLIRWALPNKPDNPSYVAASSEPQISIDRINITDLGTQFFEQARGSYKQDKDCNTLTSLL